MSKYNGVTKKKREERDAKQVSGVRAMVASIAGQTQKFINEWTEKFNSFVSEWVDKHNALNTQVVEVASNSAGEIGKMWAVLQELVRSIDHLDVNVLALAQLNKSLYTRLYRYEELFKQIAEHIADGRVHAGLVTDGFKQVEEIEAKSKDMYEADMSAAFALVNERRRKEMEEKEAARKKAEEETKAAVAAKAEAELAEKALLEAESEKLSDATSGGQGAIIPEGAQVFGGE